MAIVGYTAHRRPSHLGGRPLHGAGPSFSESEICDFVQHFSSVHCLGWTTTIVGRLRPKQPILSALSYPTSCFVPDAAYRNHSSPNVGVKCRVTSPSIRHSLLPYEPGFLLAVPPPWIGCFLPRDFVPVGYAPSTQTQLEDFWRGLLMAPRITVCRWLMFRTLSNFAGSAPTPHRAVHLSYHRTLAAVTESLWLRWAVR